MGCVGLLVVGKDLFVWRWEIVPWLLAHLQNEHPQDPPEATFEVWTRAMVVTSSPEYTGRFETSLEWFGCAFVENEAVESSMGSSTSIRIWSIFALLPWFWLCRRPFVHLKIRNSDFLQLRYNATFHVYLKSKFIKFYCSELQNYKNLKKPAVCTSRRKISEKAHRLIYISEVL